jgi:hypothetical protein
MPKRALYESLTVLRRFLRTYRLSRETQRQTRKRRVAPFLQKLPYRRLDNAWELHAAAEECLQRRRQARTLSIAEWRLGAQIIGQSTVKGYEPNPRRYIVTNVE